ncbi:MAG TPA: ATP-dependent helicase HrpB [Bryobacteraceae bacterium]|nr:ATP-dependent helicase HrpB [Bryobacteraceae bacterium]
MADSLPIDSLIPEIRAALARGPNLVIEAAPGAGKTTRVPPALLEFGGDVLVLEPRRIAARLAARRVASELGEKVGETVGYQVRFEDVAGDRTRLRFLTEGVLTRRLVSDPHLSGVGTVVLDEFHERHLETDLALALLRRLQTTKRPDLRIVIMSATLEAEPVRAFLGDCHAIRSEGRLFDLATTHTPYSAAPLEEQVASALASIIKESGDVLVFLPGAAEIRRTARACAPLAERHRLLIAPLYGDLPAAEQDRAIEPAFISGKPQRKVILATNIAESSITIEGVRIVIDSGVARIASDSPWTGLPSLEVRRISKASARQRAGRAGRTGSGRVIRLYTAEDFERRPDHDTPEILRRELSQMCLQLEAMAIRDPSDLAWLDSPPAGALAAAAALLDKLGARGAAATHMAKLPLHPRLARLVLNGGDAGCRAAALLSSGQRVQSGDLFHALEEPWDGSTRAVYDQLRRYGRAKTDDAAFGKAVLAAFADRVGRWRPGGTVLLSNGGSAQMDAAPAEFLVAIDVEDRGGRPRIRLACPIEPDWLLDHAVAGEGVEWNREAEGVEAVSALLYDDLVIDESRGGAINDEAAAKLLAVRAIEAGIERFVDAGDLAALVARVEFAELDPLDNRAIETGVTTLCYGLRSFADLKKAAAEGLLPLLEQSIGAGKLDVLAPPRLKLPSGRWTKIHYETGKPPWVASRLQDFFGLTESPRIGRARVPLVIHLLAPNQRAVQTTTDLAGFWQRLYPRVRKELGRRYPKHKWPENP